jgi:hypothetical protein
MDYGKTPGYYLRALCACALAMVIDLLDRHLILFTYMPIIEHKPMGTTCPQ